MKTKEKIIEEKYIIPVNKENPKISPKIYLKSLYEDKELNLKYDKFMKKEKNEKTLSKQERE